MANEELRVKSDQLKLEDHLKVEEGEQYDKLASHENVTQENRQQDPELDSQETEALNESVDSSKGDISDVGNQGQTSNVDDKPQSPSDSVSNAGLPKAVPETRITYNSDLKADLKQLHDRAQHGTERAINSIIQRKYQESLTENAEES